MNLYLDKIKERLTDEDISFIKEIYAPRVVASPPSEGFRSMCVMPDGEIRCYGEINKAAPLEMGEEVYISSTDGGLSFKMHRVPQNAMGCAFKSPYSDRWIAPRFNRDESYILIGSSPDCTDYKRVEVDKKFGAHHLPIALRNKRRIVFAADYNRHSVVFLSDDDGDSWRSVEIELTDKFALAPPHKGVRWENSGVEPTVCELRDGTLMMLLRTSTDYHYICYSYDFGDSWTKPEPTPFHSTLTNPELLRLSDGRIILFYNNTRPLPEQDLKSVWPPLGEGEIDGTWEDVFTNRDANCTVISEDDGNTWIGFREILLNGLRNTCDFRLSNGPLKSSGLDKSVHEFQAIELPFNKVLLHVGQHELVSKILIFDINWLYEKNRSENFFDGMGNVSTQVYLKSVSGCSTGRAIGHCAWNRTNGAVPVPDLSGDRSEAILIKNTDDDRLLSNMQGLVWNFPASKRGVVKIRLKVMGEGLRVSLCDHWINPIDMYAEMFANFSFVISNSDMTDEPYTDIEINYNTEKGVASCQIGEFSMKNKAPNGLCYLHLQTVSDSGDSMGTLIKSLDFKGE